MTMVFFGEPWDAFALIGATRAPTPVGERCGHCTLMVCEDDQGYLLGAVTVGDDGKTPQFGLVPFHKECYLRMGMGSVEHLEGRCGCATGHFANVGDLAGVAGASTEMSEALAARIDALATWDWVVHHGSRVPLDDYPGIGDDVAR